MVKFYLLYRICFGYFRCAHGTPKMIPERYKLGIELALVKEFKKMVDEASELLETVQCDNKILLNSQIEHKF